MYKNILVPIAFDEDSDTRIGAATSVARRCARRTSSPGFSAPTNSRLA